MLKLNIHKSAVKVSISHSHHSLLFLSIKKLCTKNLYFTICFRFLIIQFTIQEMAFRLCTNQRAKGKVKNKVNKGNDLHPGWINFHLFALYQGPPIEQLFKFYLWGVLCTVIGLFVLKYATKNSFSQTL